jgi:hypothetical protein
MPALAWEDLSQFLRPDEFGARISVARASGGTASFAAIFDDPFLDAQLGEYVLETSEPRLIGRAADMLGIARGDVATIDGRAYDVMSAPQGDGSGMATLRLAAADGRA